jgi:uncharacterized GH25 family protein
MKKIKLTLLALALAAVVLPAHAHRPWLLPSATLADGKEPTVIIDGAVSENYFEFDHMPLRMDSVVVTGPDGAVLALPAITSGRLRNSFDLKMPKPGTYRVAIVSKVVTASYKAGAEVKRFRGTEEAFAKEVPGDAPELTVNRQFSRMETFVSATQTSTEVLKPSGTGLELVPVTHPNDMHAGEKASWRFELNGKPLANFAFSLIPGGVKYRGVLGEIRLSTDANGVANMTLPAAGMYALNAAFPVSSEKGGGAVPPASRYSYAATLEILPQ